MHSEQYISDPPWLRQLDNIEDDVDILCHGGDGPAVKSETDASDFFQKQLSSFLNNNQLGTKLRKLIRNDRDYLDASCSMGVLVLSRKAAKAGFKTSPEVWPILYKL